LADDSINDSDEYLILLLASVPGRMKSRLKKTPMKKSRQMMRTAWKTRPTTKAKIWALTKRPEVTMVETAAAID